MFSQNSQNMSLNQQNEQYLKEFQNVFESYMVSFWVRNEKDPIDPKYFVTDLKTPSIYRAENQNKTQTLQLQQQPQQGQNTQQQEEKMHLIENNQM